MSTTPTTGQLELAQRIASLIVLDDMPWQLAKDKVMQEAESRRGAPSGSLIESAVRENFAVYLPEEHRKLLRAQREAALRVLSLFTGFPAFLSGAVLNGAAGRESSIVIEIFSDDAKAVEIELLNRGIDFEAVDPLPGPMGEPLESLGILMHQAGVSGALCVRLNIYETHCIRKNPYKRSPDPRQEDWEAMGRIDEKTLKSRLFPDS